MTAGAQGFIFAIGGALGVFCTVAIGASVLHVINVFMTEGSKD